jgi:tetratricopeptide (TPR) repeat protein
MSLPVAKQIAWISLVPQLAFMAFLMAAYYVMGTEQFVIFGAGTYLTISNLLRFLALKDHNKAVKSLKAGEFQDAIPAFQSSYDFLNGYPWIDKYRYLILLSSSKISFREMALNNIAFCYSQSGEGEKAISYYKRMFAEYPDSDLAKAALNFIAAIQKDH